MNTEPVTIYEMSINYRVELMAHSLSNSGSSSIRLLPRRQLLADGTEVDALSGNIAKHYHGVTLAEYLEAAGISLCPACAVRDGRRVAALINQPDYEKMGIDRILRGCAMCDTHGFLVTAKNSTPEANDGKDKDVEDSPQPDAAAQQEPSGGKARRKSTKDSVTEAVEAAPAENGHNEKRQRMTKHSLIEYSFGLALPEHQAETMQLFTRLGDEAGAQMMMKRSARSGVYGMCVRYKCAGVGVDTDKWQVIVTDEAERLKRHRAILSALRDCILSPTGAVTATMLPHLTGLCGAIVVQHQVGRAPVYSPLDPEFLTRLVAMGNGLRHVLIFESVDQFSSLMDGLIETSRPYLPGPRKPAPSPEKVTAEILGQD